MQFNSFITDVKATLDTDNGEVHLIVLGNDDEELLNKKCKLSKPSKKEAMIRFSMDHPETDKKESFKGIVYKQRWGLWKMYVYPQFGKGTICTGALTVNTTGNNEFF